MNLIQSYIQQIPNKGIEENKIEYNTPKFITDAKRIWDSSIIPSVPIVTTNYTKPLAGKGHLVNLNLLNWPVELGRDTFYMTKALKDGALGKANDHQLGKINDFGLKAGGIAIASYLASKTKDPKLKIMEFIGFASFFASMSLWPKIALQLPAAVLNGFNINKKYVDDQGRKKDVFRDPQYIPWDLYSDEEINKIGDWMGVEKNVNNRRDLIQERMKKIAIQNNTLWMLTAGFATPIMSALICNRLEPVVDKVLDNRATAIFNKDFSEFIEASKNGMSSVVSSNLYATKSANKFTDAFNTLLESKSGQPVTDASRKEIIKAFEGFLDPVARTALNEDLETILNSGKSKVNESMAEGILNRVKQVLAKNANATELESALPALDEIKEILKNNEGSVTPEKIDDIARQILKKTKVQGMADYKATLLKKTLKTAAKTEMSSVSSLVFDDVLAKKLKDLMNIMEQFQRQESLLDGFKLHLSGKFGAFNNATTESLIKILNFSDKELKQIKVNPQLAEKFFMEHITELGKDPEKFKKAMTELISRTAEFNSKVGQGNIEALEKEYVQLYSRIKGKLQTVIGSGSKLAEAFDATKTGLTAGEGSIRVGSKSLIPIGALKKDAQGVKYGLFRMIHAFDIFGEKLVKKTNVNGQIRVDLLKGLPIDKPELYDEVLNIIKNELFGAEAAKQTLKFNLKNRSAEAYKQLMYSVYDTAYLRGTIADVLSEVDLANNSHINAEYREYIKKFREAMGNTTQFYNRGLTVNPEQVGLASRFETSSAGKFILNSKSPKAMIQDLAKRVHNSNKWLKMFTTAGAVLLGTTLLAQLNFRRTVNK